ncbi:glmZ(sRNA)-inactivating NTPase [bacterium BMS3Abin07]|nr:glmZ(sRNA)-inactivating NTPase [bacterium BMS3Abin07]GBE32076.1 glmZ(sRNA)-inactivating NTPase [bacterium BMS3Bbin05]HDO23406.1 RNase adapter RapZ [Nitrospirota bacterium]HDZ88150.1 RNase adapter RapZ [Nitrospirota bacterium]
MKLYIIILTGLSGAGKSVALRALEDSGYFCTDNLPSILIKEFISTSFSYGNRRIAIGINIRKRKHLQETENIIISLKNNYNLDVVFLETEKDTLLRRFKETRRPHPLGDLLGIDIGKAIENEITLLAPIRDISDRVIDTTSFSPHQLRDLVRSVYGSQHRDKMNVILTSFGFKFGVPQFADLVFDVRFLPNPHFVPELRDLTGKDISVKNYIFSNSISTVFLEKIEELMNFLIPHYIKEGKAFLNICIGCTGGKHRSVAIVEELGDYFSRIPVNIDVAHREL